MKISRKDVREILHLEVGFNMIEPLRNFKVIDSDSGVIKENVGKVQTNYGNLTVLI